MAFLLFHDLIWRSRVIASERVLYFSEYTSFQGPLNRFVVFELV